MVKKNYFKYAAFACILGTMTTACSDDDAPGYKEETVAPTEMQYVITAADPTQGTMQGGVTLQVLSDLTKGLSDFDAYSYDNSGTHSGDYFTQVAYNKTTQTFTGFIYGRGASVLGSAGVRSYKLDNGKLVEIGDPVKMENGGQIGTFGPYSYVTQISDPIIYKLTRNGDNVTSETVRWDDQAIDGTLPGITGIKDLGNNQIAVNFNYGNRDSAVVAFADYDLKISKVISDDRIGAGGGATRSVRYSMIDNDDEGNTYVFCGVSNDDNKVGALRIKKGEQEFDKDYEFDIFKATGGYRFRSAIHITGDLFLLQCYNDKGETANLNAANRLAIADVKKQTVTFVTGIDDDPTKIDLGWASTYQGKVYVPINASDGFTGGGSGSGGGRPNGGGSWGGQTKAADASTIIPTIYVIDAQTAVATPLITLKSTQAIKAFTVLQ